MLNATTDTDKPARRGRAAKAKERLAAAGVSIDDVERTRHGRKPKPTGVSVVEVGRDGPGKPLWHPPHEEAARHVAGGMRERDAWRMAGYAATNYGYIQIMSQPAFQDRVAELRDEYQRRSGLSLSYLQDRLLSITTSDIGDFIEKVPYSSSRWRAKDLLSLPPEVRACVAEVNFDRSGQVNFKLHDKTKAIAELIRTVAPAKVEVSGPGGGALQLEAMLDPKNISKLSDDELAALKQIAAKLVAAGPVVEGEAEAVDDGEDSAT